MLQVDDRSNRGQHRAEQETRSQPSMRSSFRRVARTIMSSWPELEMTWACEGDLALRGEA